MSAQPPKHIKVGPYRYKVTWDAKGMEPFQDHSPNAYGFSDHRQSRIAIAPNQSESSKRDTLLHEVLHCVTFVMGMGKTIEEMPEEELVLRLSPQLLSVLRDNPELLSYLTGGSK